jgi:zinc protease
MKKIPELWWLRRISLLLAVGLSTILSFHRAADAGFPVERIDLPNGLVVLVSEEHSLPFVTLNLLVDSGAWRDPPGKAGLANLTAESLLLGTQKHPASEINEILDFMGASLEVSCGYDFAVVSLKTLKKELDQGFDLFMEAVTQPAFLEAEVQREKERILGNIQSEIDDPTEHAQKLFREIVFVESPYSKPVEGTEKTLTVLDRDSVLDFYRTYYRPNISILSIVGQITLQEVKDRLVPRLSVWPNADIPERAIQTRFAGGSKTKKEDRPISQANIVLGHEGIRRSSPDYYAVTVMNRILGGGGLSSRLMEKIRIQKGLAYSIYSTFLAHKFPGTFQVVLQTAKASAPEAVRLVLEEMKRIQRNQVSEQELETAKKYLIGSFPLRLDTQAKVAAFLAQAVYYNLGLDYPDRYPSLIRAVSREDVLQAAKKYLHPDSYVLTIVGNLEEIEKGGDGSRSELEPKR